MHDPTALVTLKRRHIAALRLDMQYSTDETILLQLAALLQYNAQKNSDAKYSITLQLATVFLQCTAEQDSDVKYSITLQLATVLLQCTAAHQKLFCWIPPLDKKWVKSGANLHFFSSSVDYD